MPMERYEFLHYFQQVRDRTMRTARCIPPDKLEWTCRNGEFTLGDLARHITATERYLFAECVCGRPSQYKRRGRDLADGFTGVIAYIERMHKRGVRNGIEITRRFCPRCLAYSLINPP